jgi:hypothetical protein
MVRKELRECGVTVSNHGVTMSPFETVASLPPQGDIMLHFLIVSLLHCFITLLRSAYP